MAYVQRIASRAEIPPGKKRVLLVLGDKNGMSHDSDGFTVTIDRNMPPNLFEAHLDTAIGEAQAIADREKIDTVFVCVPERNKKG